MRSYRCYFLNDRDRIFRADVIEAVSDEDAREIARALVEARSDCEAAELWLGTRCLGRIGGDVASQPSPVRC